MLQGKDFVLWDAKAHRFCAPPARAYFGTLQAANAYLDAPVAPEIRMLVDELTKYFGALGMHKVCKSCFRGTMAKDYPDAPAYMKRAPGIGCCAPCGLQGHNGCLSKPLGCALWMCEYTMKLFPHADAFLRKLRNELYDAQYGAQGQYTRFVTFFHDPRPSKLDRTTHLALLSAVAKVRKARQQVEARRA